MAVDHSIPTHRACTKCGLIKDLELFGNQPKGKYGKSARCKACERVYKDANKGRKNVLAMEAYYRKVAAHKEAKARARQAAIDALSKCCFRCQEFKSKSEFKLRSNSVDGHHGFCKSCCSELTAEYNKANPEKAAAWAKRWAQANPEKMKAKQDRFLAAKPGYAAKRAKAWREKNREKYLEVQARARLKRMADPSYRLHNAIGNGLRGCLQGSIKTSRTFDLLGYTLGDLMRHLEMQFLPGMTWQNFGAWHVDHVTPISSFTVLSQHDPALRQAWCLSNLRPLWATDNQRKHAKILFLV